MQYEYVLVYEMLFVKKTLPLLLLQHYQYLI
jgi:hypothetical protein